MEIKLHIQYITNLKQHQKIHHSIKEIQLEKQKLHYQRVQMIAKQD